MSHTMSIRTPYYTATIPIWLDEISLNNPDAWIQEFSQPEAAEVFQAIGAYIVIFRKPINETEATAIKSLLDGVAKLIKKSVGFENDAAFLAVGMKQSMLPKLSSISKTSEDWEDEIMDLGFEWIDDEAQGKNEFEELRGTQRIREALETCDWNSEDEVLNDANIDDFLENAKLDVSDFMKDMETDEFMIKHLALDHGNEGDVEQEEDQVEELEATLLKLQAIRGLLVCFACSDKSLIIGADIGADLPLTERKKFATKEVTKLLQTLR